MTTQLLPGWAEYGGPLSYAYWVNGYPPAEDQKSAEAWPDGHRGTDGLWRRSEVALCRSNLRMQQWINITADKALIVRADGNRDAGGQWRVFASPGAGREPHELTSRFVQFSYDAGLSVNELSPIKQAVVAWALTFISAPADGE